MVIDKETSDKIMSVLNEDDKLRKEGVIFEFGIDIPTSNEVSLKLVMSGTDKIAYDFMQEFKPMADDLFDLQNHNTLFHTNNIYRKFNFEPIFFYQQILNDPESVKQHCLNGNISTICLPTVKNPNEIIESQIYQKCVYDTLGPKKYIEWADYYNNKCLENKDWVNPHSHSGDF